MQSLRARDFALLPSSSLVEEFCIELINKSGWYQYLEVKPEQVREAVAALSMISYSRESCDGSYVGKWGLHDLDTPTNSQAL